MGRLWAAWQDRDVADTGILRRSVSDARLAGVCGGIAERYRVDPLLVRFVAVIIALSSGVGIVLYGAAWLLLPRGNQPAVISRAFPRAGRIPGRTWAVLVAVAVVTVLVLVSGAFDVSLMPTMAVLGILYASQLRPSSRPLTADRVAAPVAPYAPAPRPSQPTWPLLAPAPGQVVVTTPAGPWRPTDRWGQPLSAQNCATYFSVPDPVGLYDRRPAAPLRRSRLLAVISGLAIAAFFAMLSLLGAFVAVPGVTYLATALIMIGAALVVGAFIGRPRWFIAIAVALVLLAGLTSPTLRVGQSMTASNGADYPLASELPPAIDASGDYTLDLRDIIVDANRTTDITVSNGTLTVVLPADANYVVTWDVSPGSVLVGNVKEKSTGSLPQVVDPTAPTITIHAQVTFGKMEIVQ